MFDTTLTPAVRDTGLQLRAMGWGQDATPPLSVVEICQATGKSQATLYGHMRLLRDRGALRWRSAGTSEIIVFFEPAYWLSENLESPVKESVGDSVSFEEKSPSLELLEVNTTDLNTSALQNSGNLETPSKTVKKPTGWHYTIAKTLAEVCHENFAANKGRFLGEAKQLERATPEPTVELIREQYNGNSECYWRKYDWRGQKGQDPTCWAIRQTWGKWEGIKDRAARNSMSSILEYIEGLDHGNSSGS